MLYFADGPEVKSIKNTLAESDKEIISLAKKLIDLNPTDNTIFGFCEAIYYAMGIRYEIKETLEKALKKQEKMRSEMDSLYPG